MSTFKQTSFNSGINLLLDDSRLPLVEKESGVTWSQYRMGINVRTRFDVCSPIPSSVVDSHAPPGIKQAIITFGNYVIIFVAGTAYYKLNETLGWNNITGFAMSITAPRYWTVLVPLATTNYGRLAKDATAIANDPIQQVNVTTASGNVPGLLVQDGVNQPQFIYLDTNGNVQCRVTQQYEQWNYDPTGANDSREYVPVGTYMEWFNGILFIVDQQFNYIYRSVSGRPLDFMVNIDSSGDPGGRANTTSYSVGVGGITAIRATPGNSLFVAAGGSSNYEITLDQSNVAVKIFGEWTFNRQFLFNANCVTDRGIIDVLGDTVFIASTGLRSFNAIKQQKNEGRNSVFSANVQSLFNSIVQSSKINANSPDGWCSAINYDDYAIFSVNTTLGYVLVIYDTLNNCFVSLDVDQVGNHGVKQFAAIATSNIALYAITDDDRVVQLFADTANTDTATVRLAAMCNQNPEVELKVTSVRAILTNITEDCEITCSLFVNNRFDQSATTKLRYTPPIKTYTGASVGIDVGTQTNSVLFSFPNVAQGWKVFPVFSWTGGASLTSVSVETSDYAPMQPLRTQSIISQT